MLWQPLAFKNSSLVNGFKSSSHGLRRQKTNIIRYTYYTTRSQSSEENAWFKRTAFLSPQRHDHSRKLSYLDATTFLVGPASVSATILNPSMSDVKPASKDWSYWLVLVAKKFSPE